MGIPDLGSQIFIQPTCYQAQEIQTGELVGASTAGTIQKEIPPVHQLAHKADTSVNKGVNRTNNIIVMNTDTNMQTGQILDGFSGQENQYPYQSTQQSAYCARETTPTVSKEISETTGTIGATGIAGPVRSAVPAVLSMPVEYSTNAFFPHSLLRQIWTA